VTDVPAQTGFWEGLTTTLTGRFGCTTIVIEFDVAGLFNTQIRFEDVITQLTISPFNGT
jgi:hypothetical protein